MTSVATKKSSRKKSKKKGKKKPPWRPAVREEMRQATRRELDGRHQDQDASFDYRWEHVTTVVTLANELADLTGADADVVEAAAWLHDVCKWTEGEKHATVGAQYARKFLKRTDFPPKKIDAVAKAIAVHMGLWRTKPLKSLEAQILWDADKLSKIGLTAVFHWGGRALAGSRERTAAELIERGRAAGWQKKTVASMHTKPARRAAKARLKAYNQYWEQLERELSGTDLT